MIGPPWWKVAWIVAGGPSAHAFDVSMIDPGDMVLAVNDAVFRLRPFVSPVSVFSADPDWVSRNRAFLESFEGECHLAVALDTHPECGGIANAIYLTRGVGDGLSESRRTVNLGGNSGYGALNLAYLKNAKAIHLVGFDMDYAERGNGDKYREWAPRFLSTLPQLASAGVTVWNHSPGSSIDAFCKVSGFRKPVEHPL